MTTIDQTDTRHSTVDSTTTMSADSAEPYFTHRIQPRVALLAGALLAILVIATFIYGQFAPGI